MAIVNRARSLSIAAAARRSAKHSTRRFAPVITLGALALCVFAPPPPTAAETYLAPCAHPDAVVNPDAPVDHTDCRLLATDASGLQFDVSYWAPIRDGRRDGPDKAVKVEVTTAAGETIQTINELLEPTSTGWVGLTDVDDDGRQELVIPMSVTPFNGARNTRFSVWRATTDPTHFERTQMVGQAVYPSGDGYVVTNAGAYTSRDLTFYQPTGAGFTVIVVVSIEAQQTDPATGRVLTVACRAHQEQGLQRVRMDGNQAEDFFCASPAANAIWPDAQRISINPRRPR